jgi:predicted nucleic acid-binding protein
LSARFAIDTNVALYAFSDDPKRDGAHNLVESGPLISVQLLNEFANVARRKFGRNWDEIEAGLSGIRTLAQSVRAVDLEVHERAMLLFNRYRLSVYDSLMLAAALLGGCEYFYSEDMQHGMVIDEKMTIINPFLQPEPK